MTTFVFLGPTVSHEEAKTILPDASYLQPVECGDIIKVLRLNPSRILIIDGYYEQTAAVWHKEIMLALDQGIPVFGASSMGALRSAELAHFGMQGIGSIFNDFHQGLLVGDDEVAVVHGSEASGCRALNDAMVNIRATVSMALQQEVIDQAQADLIIRSSKARPYPKRKLTAVCAELQKESEHNFAAFLDWLSQDNYIDQKRLDALEALKHMRDHAPIAIAKQSVTSPTIFIRRLCRSINTSAFQHRFDFLPNIEKALFDLKDQNAGLFTLVSQLAMLLSICYELSEDQESLGKASTNLYAEAVLGNYQRDEKLQRVYHWLSRHSETLSDLDGCLLRYKRWVQLMYRDELAESDDPRVTLVVEQYAFIWMVLDNFSRQKNIKINKQDVDGMMVKFFKSRSIQSAEELAVWLADNHIEQDEFNRFIMSFAYLKGIFLNCNFDFLLENRRINLVNWLAKAHQATSSFDEVAIAV